MHSLILLPDTYALMMQPGSDVHRGTGASSYYRWALQAACSTQAKRRGLASGSGRNACSMSLA